MPLYVGTFLLKQATPLVFAGNVAFKSVALVGQILLGGAGPGDGGGGGGPGDGGGGGPGGDGDGGGPGVDFTQAALPNPSTQPTPVPVVLQQ